MSCSLKRRGATLKTAFKNKEEKRNEITDGADEKAQIQSRGYEKVMTLDLQTPESVRKISSWTQLKVKNKK